jgi:hypothetical protein
MVAVLAFTAYQRAEAGQPKAARERSNGKADSMVARLERWFRPGEVPLYRMEIKPIQQDTGIKSGYFIAYGHPVAPPYVVGIEEDSTVHVNGIQVQPPLPDPVQPARFAELMAPLRDLPDSIRRQYALTDTITARAYGFYANMAAAHGESSALRMTGEMVMKSGIADSVMLGYPRVLRIYEKHTSEPTVLLLHTAGDLQVLGGRLPAGPNKPEARSKLDLARQRAERIRSGLDGGRTIMVTPGEYGHLGGAGVFDAARALLSDQALSQSQKWALLQVRGFTGEMAYWLLANYAGREWQR